MRLRKRAAAHGRSMEEEARNILRDSLQEEPVHEGRRLLEVVRQSFGPLGGVELDLPPRERDWTPPTFE